MASRHYLRTTFLAVLLALPGAISVPTEAKPENVLDAADSEVARVSKGKVASCEEGKQMGLCSHPLASSVCPASCEAAVDHSAVQEQVKTPTGGLPGEGYPHLEFHTALLAALADHRQLAGLAAWFNPNAAELCMGYPHCKKDLAGISTYLKTLQTELLADIYAVHVPLSTQFTSWTKQSGSLWVPSLAFSLIGTNGVKDSCIATGPAIIVWEFGTKGDKTKLTSLRFYLDEPTFYAQADKCGRGSALLMGADGKVDAVQVAALDALADSIVVSAANNVIGNNSKLAEPWVQSWVDLFPKDDLTTQQCDPYPECVAGQEGVKARFSGFVGDFIVWSAQTLAAPKMNSDGVQAYAISYVGTKPKTGCIFNHVQLQVHELSKKDPTKLQNQFIYYSIAPPGSLDWKDHGFETHAAHDCA